jgi:superfamily II DNA or RNA helicase
MLDVLRQGILRANEVTICVSFLRFSGLSLLLKELDAFLLRNGRLKVLTSTYLNVTQPEALESLLQLPNIEVRLQTGKDGFHTKFYFFTEAFDFSYCWVGSSNLTKGGLASNIEWNLKHDNSDVIEECKQNFEAIWSRKDVFPLTKDILQEYKEKIRRELNLFPLPSQKQENQEVYHPNDAQKEALLNLIKVRSSGENKAVIIVATGVGKTFLSAFDAQSVNSKNLLFIAHREEILDQAEKTYQKVFGNSISTGILARGNIPFDANFIFATIQSLVKENNRCFVEREYDYVVIDEFHHADAPSYRKILDLTKPKFLLGITATPERQDGHDVLEICNYNVAYEVRLPEAINRGWLIPFHYFGIADDLVDYQNIKWRSGKFDPTELENALILEERVEATLKHALEKGFDGIRRATVGFCAGVRHAKFMADAFNQRGYISAAVTGEISANERTQIYQRFANPKDDLEWLFVADVLNEGIDIPAINSVLFLRPTESPGLFLQQLGRGLRLYPDTEVLTVLDFVGHHKNAWLSLKALHDSHSALENTNTETLGIAPPKNCEIILQDRTKEILLKIKSLNRTKADICREAYERLKSELEGTPPRPIDLWGRDDMPSLKDFRDAFGSWLDCRIVVGDATDWELEIEKDSPIYILLKRVEVDWQAQRVTPYALLWAMCHYPDNCNRGFEQFFQQNPHWQIEKSQNETYDKALTTLERKLAGLFVNGSFIAEIQEELKRIPLLSQLVEERIAYTLANDYRLRHCGNLRKPEDLILYGEYKRHEIINYFETQYDPARHNFGVIKLSSKHIVLLAKIDTSDAQDQFKYENKFLDSQHFSWQSQNKQRQDNEAGREITEHKKRGNTLHLFVQPGSHQSACYLGTAQVDNVTGNAPMTVILKLSQPIPDKVMKLLTNQVERTTN